MRVVLENADLSYFRNSGSTLQDRSIGTFYVSSSRVCVPTPSPEAQFAMKFIPGGKFPVVVPTGWGRTRRITYHSIMERRGFIELLLVV